MSVNELKTRPELSLSDALGDVHITSREEAEKLFLFFRDLPLLDWKKANNDCEDRANAICILLDAWKIPNCKGWVFGGNFLKKDGGQLQNLWNYHVAAAIPVKTAGSIHYYIIDPATLTHAETIEAWSHQVTDSAYSYHLVKNSRYYIFNNHKIEQTNWHKRDKQNFKWTIQGLAGINGVAPRAKAMLCFCKPLIERKRKEFMKVLQRGIQL